MVLWLRTKRLQYGEWLYWRRAAIKARRKIGVKGAVAKNIRADKAAPPRGGPKQP